jgi:hypothetical protein
MRKVARMETFHGLSEEVSAEPSLDTAAGKSTYSGIVFFSITYFGLKLTRSVSNHAAIFFGNKVFTVIGLHNKTCNSWCDDN